jgi:hypothetical protein
MLLPSLMRRLNRKEHDLNQLTPTGSVKKKVASPRYMRFGFGRR